MATETAKPFAGSVIATSQEYRDRYAPTQPDMIDASIGSTALAVANSGNTAVTIQNGGAVVQGGRYDLTAGPLSLSVAANGGGSNRFDIVCLTYDSSHSPPIYCRIVQGTAGAGLPALTNSRTGLWDFPLAHYEKQPGGNIVNLVDRRKFANGNGGVVSANTGTFPPAMFVGQIMDMFPEGFRYKWNGTNWVIFDWGPELIAIKTAHESVNASTTLQNDDVLFIPALTSTANGISIFAVYDIQAMLIIASPSATPDLKFGWTIPAGATFRWTPNGLVPTTTTQDDQIRRPMETTSTRTVATTGPSLETVAMPRGRLDTGATAGALQLQWAQNTSTAENTQIQAGSFLRAKRIG